MGSVGEQDPARQRSDRSHRGIFRTLGVVAAVVLLVALMLVPARLVSELPFSLDYWAGAPPERVEDLPAAPSADWRRLEPHRDSLGYRRDAAWLRLQLPAGLAARPVIELRAPSLDIVDVYLRRNGRKPELLAATGDLRPFWDRPVHLPTLIVPLPADLSPKDDVVLYIANDGALGFPLRVLSSLNVALRSNAARLHFYGTIAGILLWSGMFCAGMYLVTRKRHELWFAALTFSILLIQAETQGLLYAFAWPSAPALNFVLSGVPVLLALSLVSFTFCFLDGEPRGINYRLLRAVQILLLIFLGAWLLGHLTGWFSVDQFTFWRQPLFLIVAIGVAFEGAKAALRGVEKGQVFFAVLLFVVLGGIIRLARAYGLIASSLLTDSALEIGAVFSVAMLAATMLRENYAEKNRRISAQQELIQQKVRTTELQNDLIQQAFTHPALSLPNRQALVMALEQLPQAGTLLLIEFRAYDNIERTMGWHVATGALLELVDRLREWEKEHASFVVKNDSAGPFYAVQDNVISVVLRTERTNEALETIRGTLKEGVRLGRFEVDMAPVFASVDCQHDGLGPEEIVFAGLSSLARVNFSPDYVSYHPSHLQEGRERLFLLSALSMAVERSELEVYLQPMMSLSDHEVLSAEMLLRWNHKVFGPVSPTVFMPLAEETGVVTRLTSWMTKQLSAIHLQLVDAGIDIGLSMNVSAEDLARPEAIEAIIERCRRSLGNCDKFKLELTETAIMRGGAGVQRSVKLLEESGIGFAIDDFGVGYSSLSRIYELPISEIKIDRSLLEQAVIRGAHTVLQAAVSIAKSMGVRAVVEGVSTREQLSLLGKLQVEAVQGFVVAPPMPVAEFIEWSKQRTTRRVRL